MAPPLIGITGHQLTGAALGLHPAFGSAPFAGYFADYAASVASAGGLPVNVPYEADPGELVDRLDGLLLTGGEDVDHRRYGAVPDSRTTPLSPARDELETQLLEAALARGRPVLAICRGIQLVNVAVGGTLVADLPVGTGESHAFAAYPRDARTHEVHLEAGSRAHRLLGDRVRVNSFHHQAVDSPGTGLVVTGRAPDGVIECLEGAHHPLLAVQWHPEALGGDPVFGWLIEACTT